MVLSGYNASFALPVVKSIYLPKIIGKCQILLLCSVVPRAEKGRERREKGKGWCNCKKRSGSSRCRTETFVSVAAAESSPVSLLMHCACAGTWTAGTIPHSLYCACSHCFGAYWSFFIACCFSSILSYWINKDALFIPMSLAWIPYSFWQLEQRLTSVPRRALPLHIALYKYCYYTFINIPLPNKIP